MEATQTNNTWIYIGLISFVSILAYFLFANTAVAGVKVEDLEGYEVDFESPGREKEIEIVYQYYINDPLRDTEFLKKEYIGVDLYDIDGDGKKEILYMISHPAYCGNRGCAFNILKQSGKNDQLGNPIYTPIRWDVNKNNNGGLSINTVKILKTTTLRVHDLLLDSDVIWKWQGTYYDYHKNIYDLQN